MADRVGTAERTQCLRPDVAAAFAHPTGRLRGDAGCDL